MKDNHVDHKEIAIYGYVAILPFPLKKVKIPAGCESLSFQWFSSYKEQTENDGAIGSVYFIHPLHRDEIDENFFKNEKEFINLLKEMLPIESNFDGLIGESKIDVVEINRKIDSILSILNKNFNELHN